QPPTSRAFALAPPPLGPSAAAAADERPAGASLDARTRARLERGFGAPLDGVRVHAGAPLPALAAAEGRDIYFAAGAYEPGTLRGDALIAHEVAHVLQQRAASNGVEPVTADVERDATASSVAALASTLVPGALPARPSLTTPLALRRCNGGGGDRPGGGVAYATAPEVSTEQFEAGNVPGERPVTSLLAGGVNQFRFDGDGDGMKELDGRMRTISSWPNGAARVIEFSLTQLSSNTKVTHTFEIPEQPGGFGLIPIVQEFTDGRRPTRIDLLGGGLRQELVFYPPERTPQAVTYR